MKAKSRQSGVTLTEMTVVVALVALLVSLGLPAVRVIFDSFESQGGARTVIRAALASARAIAAKEQCYAGVRFQKAYHPNGPLRAPQYMIFIVYEEPRKMGNLTTGFRAVEGVEPIKLPDSVGVMDLRYRRDLLGPQGDGLISSDIEIASPEVVTDTTTFSIVFSPSGKMVIHDVRVRNRDGEVDGRGNVAGISNDDVFNKKVRVDAGIAMFYQDDYFGAQWSPYPALLGLGEELSRNRFVIYEEEKFRPAYQSGRAWSDYLRKLVPEYINPYTGTMIER